MLLYAQAPLPYRELHQRLFSVVRDTSRHEWLARLRSEMEAIRHLEWNDRFFREIIHLYMNQSDSLSELLSTVRRYVKVDSAALAQLFLPLIDRTADAGSLSSQYAGLLDRSRKDTTHTSYLIRQGALLARSVIECWVSVPENPPLVPLVEAALKGYFRALAAAYAFFGFDESPETWQEKMRIIEAIGLLEYYAYGESANAFRGWKRGLLRW